ncbi:MAG: RNA 3'-terminal phosphate cyclase, partial [Candidatus Hydrothermarchaeaceae archaeon]
LDIHMSDQIIPYMGLATGRSKVWVGELTNHLKTNVHVVEDILGVKFRISEVERGHLIEVDGIGFEA